jgi:hypothetical protein
MRRRTLVPLALAAAGCVALPAVAVAASANAAQPARWAQSAVAPAIRPPVRATARLLPAVDTETLPSGITDLGVVVGNSGSSLAIVFVPGEVALSNPTRPWRWAAGRLQLLATGGAAGAEIDGVNRFGATSGSIRVTATAAPQATQWDALGRRRPVAGGALAAAAINDQGDLLLNYDLSVLPQDTVTVAVLSRSGNITAVDSGNGVETNWIGGQLNDRGDVIFDEFGPRTITNVERWQKDGSVTNVGYGAPYFGLPTCVSQNDRGQVIGSTLAGTLVARLTQSDNQQTDLPPGPGETSARPGCSGHAINEFGEVTGTTTAGSDSPEIPVVWRGGVRHVLGDGSPGEGTAINDLGQVTGVLRQAGAAGNTISTPVLWSPASATSSAALKLPVPSGWTFSSVLQVNNRGQVLGIVQQTGADGIERVRPVVWTTS